jgi:hypothetical protein
MGADASAITQLVKEAVDDILARHGRDVPRDVVDQPRTEASTDDDAALARAARGAGDAVIHDPASSRRRYHARQRSSGECHRPAVAYQVTLNPAITIAS